MEQSSVELKWVAEGSALQTGSYHRHCKVTVVCDCLANITQWVTNSRFQNPASKKLSRSRNNASVIYLCLKILWTFTCAQSIKQKLAAKKKNYPVSSETKMTADPLCWRCRNGVITGQQWICGDLKSSRFWFTFPSYQIEQSFGTKGMCDKAGCRQNKGYRFQ